MNMLRDIPRGMLPEEKRWGIASEGLIRIGPEPATSRSLVYQAEAHGAGCVTVQIVSSAGLTLQGRSHLRYFATRRHYRLWQKYSGISVSNALIYPTCYTLSGDPLPGALVTANYG